MTLEQIVSAIRSLPVPERLRVIELAAHDIASDVAGGSVETRPGAGMTLIERHGLLVAHAEAGATLPEELFDHRVDRDVRAKLLWAGS
jgi:hypothetical protein